MRPDETGAIGAGVLRVGDAGPPAEEELDDDPRSLVELINRVLDKGVCIRGDITLSVAGVDLVYLGLNALLTSVSTARRVVDPTLGVEGRGAERPEG